MNLMFKYLVRIFCCAAVGCGPLTIQVAAPKVTIPKKDAAGAPSSETAGKGPTSDTTSIKIVLPPPKPLATAAPLVVKENPPVIAVTPAITVPTPPPSPTATVTPAAVATLAPVPACSTSMEVLASANIWLTGAPAGTELVYPNYLPSTTDRAPAQSPVQYLSDCLAPGKMLAFQTDSTASTGTAVFIQRGEGTPDPTSTFALGAVRGISNVNAPLASLIGVFVPAGFDGTQPPPEMLDFGNPQAREFDQLAPKLRQVFFIGSGRKLNGTVQKFIVPAGAVSLSLGTMDLLESNNNVGSHKVKVSEIP